ITPVILVTPVTPASPGAGPGEPANDSEPASTVETASVRAGLLSHPFTRRGLGWMLGLGAGGTSTCANPTVLPRYTQKNTHDHEASRLRAAEVRRRGRCWLLSRRRGRCWRRLRRPW